MDDDICKMTRAALSHPITKTETMTLRGILADDCATHRARIAELEAALLGAEIALVRDANVDAAVKIILVVKRK